MKYLLLIITFTYVSAIDLTHGIREYISVVERTPLIVKGVSVKKSGCIIMDVRPVANNTIKNIKNNLSKLKDLGTFKLGKAKLVLDPLKKRHKIQITLNESSEITIIDKTVRYSYNNFFNY